MAGVVFAIAVGAGVTLIVLLLATLAVRDLRLWPTPGEKTWQSYVWWPLFRGLNVLCVVVALSDPTSALGLPLWLRAVAFLALVGSTATFLYAFFKLGRDNSYGAQDGLVTAGIYQWSRNPQNAMLIVVYACLALTTDTARTYLVCAAMMAVYFLMVLAEEPWLTRAYGEAYRAYCKAVPRFFNVRRALQAMRPQP